MNEPAVAYVLSRWGEPTQTFVRREAGAVGDAGCRVRVLSLKRPIACPGLANVVWLGPREVVAGAIRAIVRRPGKAIGVLLRVACRSHRRNVGPQLVAALIGLAWAGRGLVEDEHLHAHFGWVAATAAWAAASMARRPYSVVLHAFELHDRRRSDRFTSVPLAGAAQVFTISDRDRGIVRTRWGVEARVLRMGVPAEWLVDGGNDRDPWLVLAVGSLVPKKGHGVLIEALAAADRRWKLVILGEGTLRPELEEQVGRLGLSGRVRLLGHRDEQEVREWLSRAAVACLASTETSDGDRDGIPVALMEAMALGAAVVATDVGAIRELVDVEALVAPDDPIALSLAIDLMRDGSRRRHAVQRGRARIAAEFVAERAALPVVELARRSDETAHVAA